MDRFLQNTAATLTATFYVNGVATDPSPTTTTVTITREDGTTLTSGSATRTGTGVYSFALTTAQTANLDCLTAAWTSSLGTILTYAEIVGGFLTTITALRSTKPLDNTGAYATADLLACRTLAEAALEDACGVPFVPRYFHVTVDGKCGTDLLLPPRPLSITSAAVDGTALDSGALGDLELYEDGTLYNPLGWARGRRNVEIKGTYGYRIPPPRVGLAVNKLVKRWLVDSPISDRATSISDEGGGTSFLLTAGIRDQLFDVPESLAVVVAYGVETIGIA